jgi:hypothetical protein
MSDCSQGGNTVFERSGKPTQSKPIGRHNSKGGREMNEAIKLPDMNEIAGWLDEQCQVERTRLRNELAFIQGDRAHGGPAREDLAAALKFRLAAIDEHLEDISSGRRPL